MWPKLKMVPMVFCVHVAHQSWLQNTHALHTSLPGHREKEFQRGFLDAKVKRPMKSFHACLSVGHMLA